MRSVIALLFTTALSFSADEVDTPKSPKKNDDRTPKGNAAMETAEGAMKNFAAAPGLKLDVWASEPLLENPIAFSFDNHGRALVAVTQRRRTSVPDIRKHEEWKIENLGLRTVEERIAFLKAMMPESPALKPKKAEDDINKDGQLDWRDWAVESEEIRIVEDGKGAGRADKSLVLASGFNSLETGLGAGVLAMPDGGAIYTCAPDLWRIAADGTKTKLASGFGVHVAYGGHDMHGVKMGMDGRVYFTIADCGSHVMSKDGKMISFPDGGAVFRCFPDGSGLELYAWGLRNPQSLAFNDVGDLFTGDNNADGGDKARWTHVIEGADYGWRIGWQFLPKLGAWNSEGMWHLDVAQTNAAVVPPVAHITHGPGGIAYYPGTGLPEKYRDNFFIADFPGGVRHFALKQKGAGYEVAGMAGDDPLLQNNSPSEMRGKLLWNLYPSDVQFAPGGGVYVLDWVYGWEKTGKGRIYRLHDPAVDKSVPVQETQRLLTEDFTKLNVDDLVKLLGNVDQRVRVKAQFELVSRGDSTPLTQTALGENAVPARLHAIWGVAQLAHSKPEIAQSLAPLTTDKNAEVRAQWAKLAGETKQGSPSESLIHLLSDSNARVRFFAAQSLGKLKAADAVSALTTAVKANADADPALRHALVLALSECAPATALAALQADSSESLRLATLIALRRQRSAEVARFLTDASVRIRVEAARAIHDAPIPAAVSALASQSVSGDANGIGKLGTAPFASRVVNANYRLGTAESAARLAAIASDAALAPEIRLDALEALAQWPQKLGRDRVLGIIVEGDGQRKASDAAAALAPQLAALFGDKSGAVRIAALTAAGSNKLTAAGDTIAMVATSSGTPGEVRAAALRALESMESPKLSAVVTAALESGDKSFADAARKLAGKLSPAMAVKANAALLGRGSTREQQDALANIADVPGPEADAVISKQLDQLLAGKLKPGVILDLLEAAAERDNADIKRKLAAFEASRKADDPLARWRECIEGGEGKLGKQVFAEKSEAACMRCHKVKGDGGDVGPDLAEVGKQKGREYVLRAIVDPNSEIAKGYDNVMITLKDGNIVAGLATSESADEILLKNPADAKIQRVKKSAIKERTSLPSAMPPGLGEILTRRELRDLVQYLSTLK